MLLPTDILHPMPRVVPLRNIEHELGKLRQEAMAGIPVASGTGKVAESATAASLRACTLTLVVLCDRNEDPTDMTELLAEIVESHPARIILIAQHDPKAEAWVETRISSYTVTRGATPRFVGEEVAFYPRGERYDSLPSAVLALRVSGLPLVLYWRGQPDLDDSLFRALVPECDGILFDSQHFTARAQQINSTLARLRRNFPKVSFGDVNWQRIRPWREFVAQFFDDPANMQYLDTIARVQLDFSIGLNGNQSAPILFMAWFAGALGWRVVRGSYERQGMRRMARFERLEPKGRAPREIQFDIQVREQQDCLPGEITGVRIETQDDLPEAVFQAARAVGGFVDIKELTLNRFSERCLVLNVPHESAVLTSELDAPRHDRNYHRALDVIEALVAPMT
ncbi:MAG: glucose-6-phosphate dehydrogenase assembly protein OpcA [Anaerolineae bacterium]|nr:glucose-6-phosphate dehydrogenase assembly protein OpcA [Anaerolineae bacterium]